MKGFIGTHFHSRQHRRKVARQLRRNRSVIRICGQQRRHTTRVNNTLVSNACTTLRVPENYNRDFITMKEKNQNPLTLGLECSILGKDI